MALSKSERDRQYNDAKAFIDLMRDRTEEEMARPLASTLRALERMMLGAQPTPFDASRASNISPRMMWALDVGRVLRTLGREVSYIALARLGRRQKSHDQSWPVILGEMEHLAMYVTEQEAKRMLRDAIPLFLLGLELEGITRDYKHSDRSSAPSSDRCAAAEQGEACHFDLSAA